MDHPPPPAALRVSVEAIDPVYLYAIGGCSPPASADLTEECECHLLSDPVSLAVPMSGVAGERAQLRTTRNHAADLSERLPLNNGAVEYDGEIQRVQNGGAGI